MNGPGISSFFTSPSFPTRRWNGLAWVISDLTAETLFVDDAGHWVKFVVVRTEVTVERPHGLSYSLTLGAPNGARLIGFDNAHPVRERRGPGGGQPGGTRPSAPAAHDPALRVRKRGQAARGFLEGNGPGASRKRINPMKTLKIGIAGYDQMKARTMAIARGERRMRDLQTRNRFGGCGR
ncbi:MAG: hypothetical protein OXF01_16460 [Gemmatimonadetes bacterium]|nr:hypothetical protein [Gemmatimonadota bacterium]